MLTPKQKEFLERYVINSAVSLDQNLDKLSRKDRMDKVDWVAKTIQAGFDGWQKRLDGIREKEPRDRLLNYGWMDRDAKGFRAMLNEARVFMKPEAIATCEKNIARLIQQADDGRLGMRHDVSNDAKYHLESKWPSMARSAASAKSRKDLLAGIEEIEHEMDAMRLSLELAGDAPGMIDGFLPELQKLRDLYDSKVPAFDGKVKQLPRVDDKEPALTYDEGVCLKLFDLCGRNWFELKKQYKSAKFMEQVTEKLGARPASGEEIMWQLWAYRKKIVDDLIAEATSEFEVAGKGTGWVAVGSTNLESDYDLSVMQHGKKGEDWEVVDWFNKQFQSRFSTQPGMMFDTNLYASAPPKAKMSDNPETTSEKTMAAMARSGQDVGALMKQRRFMSWDEYEDMMNTVLDQMEKDKAPPEVVKATRTQFEEADSRYQMAQVQTLERSEAVLAGMIEELMQPPDPPLDPDLQKQRDSKINALKALQAEQKRLKSAAEGAKGAEAAKLILERAEMLENAGDVMLAVTNAIYVDAVKESRRIDQQAKELASEIEALEKELERLAQLPAKTDDDKKAIENVQEQLAAKQQEFDGRSARSKDLFTDAVFFANEAYHSDGPFKHIVQATQAVESDVERAYDKEHGEGAFKALEKGVKDGMIGKEMTERRGKLSLHDCLQSFNEQLGDFIKDLHHHANEKDEDLPGTGFYRSSKYLDRLVDAVDLLENKVEGGLGVRIPGKLASLKEYRTALDTGLLALRKGKIAIEKDGVDDAARLEQMEAFAIEQIDKLFGVTTLHDLGKKFKAFGSAVNAKLRALVAKEMEALDAQAFFKKT